MAAEEHNGGGSPSESPTKVDHSFDDLARALAEGSISRRRALKLFAGSAIAALIPSRALAKQQKITICHKPGTPDEKTMEVPHSAVAGHLGHGDREGPCGTTTTTTTSTTSTSTSTSSTTSTTSTSTTSTSTSTTSTTTMCRPNGGTCSANDQCCSGRCASGMCAEPCSSDRVLLDNGTCVLERDPNACFCPTGCSCGFEEDPASSTRVFCISMATDTPCPNGHIDCPTGQFCTQRGINLNECVVAC